MKIMYPCLNFLQSSGANPYSRPARNKEREKQFSVTLPLDFAIVHSDEDSGGHLVHISIHGTLYTDK